MGRREKAWRRLFRSVERATEDTQLYTTPITLLLQPTLELPSMLGSKWVGVQGRETMEAEGRKVQALLGSVHLCTHLAGPTGSSGNRLISVL